ncbi:MAG: helix-turn-helix transcriptional regulator [Anaerolineales bacterium]|nr:helix-turn-helix transcriptional regulator [Anaerolineales bacterium]
MTGERWCNQGRLEQRRLPGQDLPADASAPAGLTAQEKNVLRLLAADYTYAQIAEELIISLNTVRAHVTSIYRKLAVHRRDQAIAAVYGLGGVPR